MSKTFTKGEQVTVTCGDKTVDAVIAVVSSNNVSVLIEFEETLDGCYGGLPLLLYGNVYRSLLSGAEVTIRKRRLH